ncbi:MarR family winged helix-turn-helix transcriptional regulator [Elongatibacter sediminis]|uniref:MarR family transcriptional regulator n=1 Tax=Elongatibacter sediminis TaxID=3119006 RepID=A0AAW9RPC6_9GAMM
MPTKTNSADLLIQINLLAARLSRRAGNRLSMHGLSLTEYLAMHYLGNAPQAAVPRIVLADHLGMSASGVTRLLAPMIKTGLVEKTANPRDARQSLVSLSTAGQRVLQETETSFRHIADDLLHGLDSGDRQTLSRLVTRAG